MAAALPAALLALSASSRAADDPAGAPRPASAAARQEAAEKLLKGDRKGALDAARKAREADPSDVEAQVLYQESARGEVAPAILIGEYRALAAKSPGGPTAFLLSRLLPLREAEELLRKAGEKDPNGYWVLVGTAALHARAGRGQDAEQTALGAAELRPGDAAAARRAGGQCAEAYRFPAAEAAYRKAVESDPKDLAGRLGLAHSLLRQSRLDEARVVTDALLREASKDRRVLGLAAAILLEKGDLAGAEGAYQKLCAADAADMDALLQLSMCRIRRLVLESRKTGQDLKPEALEPALREIRKVSKALPDRADAHYALGYASELQGKHDDALAAYREVARLDPLNPDVFTAVGSVFLAKGQIEDALAEFRKALSRNPKDSEALFAVGFAFDLQGKVKEAMDSYQQLLKVDPACARAWHGLGLDQDALGKLGEAAASLKKAAELEPKNPDFQRDLGEALYAQKKYEQASTALQAAVHLDPKDQAAWGGLARCKSMLKKFDEAVAAYEKIVELDPEDVDVHLAAGIIYQEFLHEYEKALVHYSRYLALAGDAVGVDKWISECQAEVAKKNK